MTFIIGMSKAEGIYLSVDYRVTRGRDLVDDATVKFLAVHYPPLDGGVKALFAFTGRAYMADGTPTGQWLRETLRGEVQLPNQSMLHLYERLNRDGADGQPLILHVLSIQGEDRRAGVFTNAEIDQGRVVGSPTFYFTGAKKLVEPVWFANGSGASTLMRSPALVERLQSQVRVRPRRVEDHMKLLASLNRRVATKDPTVSPFRHVAFFGPDGKPRSKAYSERGETTPMAMPILLGSVDIEPLFQDFWRWSRAVDAGDETAELATKEVLNEQLRRRP